MELSDRIIQMGASKYDFAQECFANVMTIESPHFHRELCNDLGNPGIIDLVVQAPRGHAKTTYVACIDPIHEIIYSALTGAKPHFIVMISKSSSHTRSLVKTIRSHLTSNLALRFHFEPLIPDLFNPEKWVKDTEDEITLANNTTILALGLGSAIHGLTRYNMRPSIIIIDDPEEDSNAGTQAAVDKNYTWFEKTVYDARDPLRCRTRVIGTMINQNCLVDRLSRTDGWTSRFYQAIPGWSEGMGKMPVLWEALWPFDKLMARKEALEKNGKGHVWWMNYQNEYKTGDNQPWKRHYFRKFKGEVVKLTEGMIGVKVDYAKKYNKDGEEHVIFENKVIPINVFWGYDPASSTSARADETAISFWGMDYQKRLFKLWKYHGRVDPLYAAKLFYEKVQEYLPTGGNIETVQAQETIRSYLRHRCQEDNTWIPGIESKNQPRTKKSERLISNLWRFKEGFVYVMEDDDEDLIGQYCNYVVDKEAQHEDMMDADYYAFLGCYPCDTEWGDSIDQVAADSRRSGYVDDYHYYDEDKTTWMSE